MDQILIIEDSTDINHMIAEALGKAGYGCTQAFSGTEGLMYIEKTDFSLIIMDLMLPGMNGEELLPRIREISGTPVIVLSAKDSLDSKLELLNAGAEDYMTKPFELAELVARAGVQIRRFSADRGGGARKLTYKEMILDNDSYSVTVGGTELSLTKQEYKILELLLSYPNRVFSKQDIYDYAWDDLFIGEDKVIHVHISNIRRKLKEITDTEYIETVWGIGFKLAK